MRERLRRPRPIASPCSTTAATTPTPASRRSSSSASASTRPERVDQKSPVADGWHCTVGGPAALAALHRTPAPVDELSIVTSDVGTNTPVPVMAVVLVPVSLALSVPVRMLPAQDHVTPTVDVPVNDSPVIDPTLMVSDAAHAADVT